MVTEKRLQDIEKIRVKLALAEGSLLRGRTKSCVHCRLVGQVLFSYILV